MRYWSDFNRVYYHPRSIQQVSDLPDWQANKGDWNYGRDIFRRFDLENSLSDGSLRRLLEESNNFQGFQMTFDNLSFGGFSIGLLEAIRDEQPKIPVLTFPLLSGVDPYEVDQEDALVRKLVLQDAVCLCSLDELGTQNVSIPMPTSWQLGTWSEQLSFDRNNLYQSTAVISAHIESSTLPLRLKSTHEDLSDFCNHLNWSQNTRFSHLSGVLPFRDGINLDEAMYDFSAGGKHANQYLVQRNVSRGLTIGQARSINTYFASSTSLEEPCLSSIHAPAYPLPSSFPNISLPRSTQSNNSNLPSSTNKRERNISLISSLHTTTSTAAVLRGYAALCRACIVRRYSGTDVAGLETDEVREMVEKLEAIAESYAAQKHEESEEGDDDLGEDGAVE
ncbi:uncharacterized protein FOMMEDRAFT_166736 [Fomitiporia mediterranea MF3/22]|uniref:uncharacterized protein n=1 Tax=Fomitiporia mediterranea (strain MF3/22) TaxID=694068 RepID=UPI000440873E|nr:uncharacterized protein FOMMEDRAFT_166736 [Fomitiporia mediterranea MF3/22]EJD05035.1 hypothetical protein FOMMEDRAFT_166736 [Fomitiporia mediterranea MF3/22]